MERSAIQSADSEDATVYLCVPILFVDAAILFSIKRAKGEMKKGVIWGRHGSRDSPEGDFLIRKSGLGIIPN